MLAGFKTEEAEADTVADQGLKRVNRIFGGLNEGIWPKTEELTAQEIYEVCWKKCRRRSARSGISDDDVSSDVITFSRKLQCIQRKLSAVVKRSARDEATSYRKKNPVASYCSSAESYSATSTGCQLLSSIQMAKTTRSLQKNRTQVLFPVGTLQDTFEREEFCVQQIQFNRGFICEVSAIEELDEELVTVRLSQKIYCTVHQQRENEQKSEVIDRH
ncbi:protein trichome birefringence-like 43 [Dorcoceras hygrometricum]|uniref:Protein trichome birefringence-like 43 n=1 Tax=Dorcoceras hygrometricum TaxID=472368 RepID=A0A2Z7C8G1_9LAMI|nr:protein trichome birefringence-like 43 [Dorcoceras hygrometricum]